MRPSAYDAVLSRDQVIEDHDQVKVVFAGGNVFHLFVEGVERPEIQRTKERAWERAEAIRIELNPDYQPPAEPMGGETNDAGADNSKGTPPAENPPPASPPATAGADTGKGSPKEPDGSTKRVMFGDIEGVMRLMPVDDVMDLLGMAMGRVALLQGNKDTRRLHGRVRATDGRCAPVFFTREGDDLSIYDGLSTLAAARNLGMSHIAVVILPSKGIHSVQSMIASMRLAAMSPEGVDDDMIYRAYGD